MNYSKSKTMIILNKITKMLFNIVLFFVCLIALFMLFFIISSQIHSKDETYKPNISLYTIVSPSMEPIINVYDVVVNQKVSSPEDIQVGDIITYISTNPASTGMRITHRVIEVSSSSEGIYEYRTQGDNNSEPDSVYVTFDNVIGKEIVIIPSLGRLQFLLANKKGWLLVLLIPFIIFFYKDILNLLELIGLKKKVTNLTNVETNDNKKEIENQRKEEIKNRLKEKENDEYVKNELENKKIMEEYKESIITVESKEYNKNALLTHKDEVKASNIVKQTLKKKPKVINEKIEILDTDSVTKVIKEYDEKINKLDMALKDLDAISKTVSPTQTAFVEKNDYLQGGKLKVVKTIVPRRKKQEKIKSIISEITIPIVDTKKEEKKLKDIDELSPISIIESEDSQIEIKSIKKYKKESKRIERPEGKDIKDLNKDLNPVKEKNTREVLEKEKTKLVINPLKRPKVKIKKNQRKAVKSKKQVIVKNNKIKNKKEKFIQIKKVR